MNWSASFFKDHCPSRKKALGVEINERAVVNRFQPIGKILSLPVSQ
jgi:hypothetical protein